MTTAPIPVSPGTQPNAAKTAFPWLGLITLAVGIFLAISSEMMPTGLLPQMSSELGVTEAQVGLLVSIFAFTVVIATTPMNALTARLPRHALLVAVIAILGIANLLTALAPTYELVLLTRILGGLVHGLFWSIVPAYAARLVSREQLARATAIISGGGTVALVLGVPLGTALGHAVGWRWSFVLVAALLLVGALVVLKFLPRVEREVHHHPAGEPKKRDETAWPVAIICIVVGVLMVGNYTFYTYITPYIIERIGVAPELVSVVLFIAGSAGILGLFLIGTVFAQRTGIGLIIGLMTSAAAVLVLALAGDILWLGIVAIFVWNAAFGLIPPLLQTRMLRTASPRIRDTSTGFYTVAFNVGIGGGAALGAFLFEWRGLDALPIANIVLTLVGLVIVLVSGLLTRRSARIR
jgi:predicted MFS family arabinose efflux permease